MRASMSAKDSNSRPEFRMAGESILPGIEVAAAEGVGSEAKVVRPVTAFQVSSEMSGGSQRPVFTGVKNFCAASVV